MDVILSVYSENAAHVVITTWGWHNRTSIACYISSKFSNLKKVIPNILLAKKNYI